MDYEAVLVALGDVNRLSRFLFRGGVSSQSLDPTGVPTTREDVIDQLLELRHMLDRMFNRLHNMFRQR